jgi:filamentous hemagglutinin
LNKDGTTQSQSFSTVGSTGGSVSISISISVGGEIIKGGGSKLGKDAVSDLTGAVLGGYIGEKTGNAVKDELDKKDKTDAKK